MTRPKRKTSATKKGAPRANGVSGELLEAMVVEGRKYSS